MGTASRPGVRALLALAIAACAPPAPPSVPAPPSTAPLAIAPRGVVASQGEAAEAAGAQRTAPHGGDAIVLDARDDGTAITGRVRPFPPDADPARIVDLDPSIATLAPGLAGAAVIDARFAGGSIVVVGTDRVLHAHDPDGRTRVLDTEVHAPLSVAGGAVAYARGEIPELEIARVDVVTGEVARVTHAMAPAWSPALSADGRAIVFASGVEGSPGLYRVDESGPAIALTRTVRVPSSPRAPRWIDDILAFEDEQGPAAIDLATGREVPMPQGRAR